MRLVDMTKTLTMTLHENENVYNIGHGETPHRKYEA
jgi:hypothetical protein